MVDWDDCTAVLGLPLSAQMLCWRLTGRMRSNIPAHVGLGSGTQLALAVGTALAQLGGLKLSVTELSSIMKRGVHSGIGIATFQHGGFVVDGGHPVVDSHQALPPVLFRHPVPE